MTGVVWGGLVLPRTCMISYQDRCGPHTFFFWLAFRPSLDILKLPLLTLSTAHTECYCIEDPSPGLSTFPEHS